MSRLQDIQDDLNDTARFYRELLLTSNYFRSDCFLSWNGYQSGILKNITYAEEYQTIIDTRQYSLLFLDGAAIQFYYRFKELDTIYEARLAYYPVPFERLENDQDIYDSTFHTDFMERIRDQKSFSSLNQSHFRIDYSTDECNAAPCHIQFGGLNGIRLNTKKLIYPMAFLDFVTSNIYPEARRRAVETNKTYERRLARSIHNSIDISYVFEKLIYVSHD